MATKKKPKHSANQAARKIAAKKMKSRSHTVEPRKATTSKANNSLRIRMYRVGFGDFFLITVPTESGPQHILIDCGVHAGNIKSIDACVQDLVKETDRKLALVIATHYHADHLSGFASNFDEFAQFEVGMVWLPNRLDPKNNEAARFKMQIRSLADQLQLRLGARIDEKAKQAQHQVQNALGVQLGATDREGDNEKALRLLTEGFKNKPPVRYYQGGDIAELPQVLKGAITAELLGPAPLDSGKEFVSRDNKREQYLGAVADGGLPTTDGLLPFEKNWPASFSDYPPTAFSVFRTEKQIEQRVVGGHETMEKLIQDAQPDVLLALTDAVDGVLNNQSLVTLFTCRGKKLLFVGDAQWGNWSYWLYGRKVTGEDPGISERAKAILGSIDFFKVGHHGSANANPIPAIAALNQTCVSMCSTESGDPDRKRPYGDVEQKTEVPRIDLMVEMQKRTNNRLVRSDWIKVANFDASPEARGQLAKLPVNFETGDLFIDYIFPN